MSAKRPSIPAWEVRVLAPRHLDQDDLERRRVAMALHLDRHLDKDDPGRRQVAMALHLDSPLQEGHA